MLDLDIPIPTYVTEYHRAPVKVTMQDGQQLVILGEQVLSQHGPYRRVRRYVKGKHPELGPLQIGWSGGWETVWECDVLHTVHTFEVKECTS